MNFPVKTVGILHRSGGTIVQITGIGHQVSKPREGRSWDIWFYKGDVKWDDGGESLNLEIPPFALHVEPEGRAQYEALSDAMMEYLNKHGKWCDRESKHEGWYANVRGKK
jgi:hypothetical protein